MKKYIATRELLYSQKGDSARKKLVVKIGVPYPIKKGTVSFRFHPGAAVCEIEFDGLPENLIEKAHGVDSIQALSLATDIDSYLKILEKKYDLYWPSGEPYFEE